MTTPTHDPLTADQIALLDEAPFEISVAQQIEGKYRDVNYLALAGYLAVEKTHISADDAKNRFRFTRTAKPLP